MGKGRERQIILKTDQRTVLLEMGLGGKFQQKSSAWDGSLFSSAPSNWASPNRSFISSERTHGSPGPPRAEHAMSKVA
jgi:hypothetical protein